MKKCKNRIYEYRKYSRKFCLLIKKNRNDWKIEMEYTEMKNIIDEYE